MPGLTVLLAPITRRCSMCDSHHGFLGPSGYTTLCDARGMIERIGIGSGKCPRGYWDASNVGSKPIVVAPPPTSKLTHAERLLNLRDSGAGRVLILVANGPGHREAELDRLRCEPFDFMSVNKPDPRLWPTKYWTFVDKSQLDRHREEWRGYTGIIFNNGATKEQHDHRIIVKNSRRGKFETDLIAEGAHIGYTTSHLALQLALWLGYDHVYCFGIDMNTGANGRLYAWGSNPDVDDEQRIGRFVQENRTLEDAGRLLTNIDQAKRFTICSSHAQRRGWGFLKYFETLDHVAAVETILERHVGALLHSAP